MAVFSFSKDESDIFTLRKAPFRMILSRAAEQLTDPFDIEEIRASEAMDGLAFDLIDDEQRTRLVTAVIAGVQTLQQELATGRRLEEPVLPGIDEKLNELLHFLSAHHTGQRGSIG
jgi:hypothetical protein